MVIVICFCPVGSDLFIIVSEFSFGIGNASPQTDFPTLCTPFPWKHTGPVISSTHMGEGSCSRSTPGSPGLNARSCVSLVILTVNPFRGRERNSWKGMGRTVIGMPVKDPFGGFMQTQQSLVLWIFAISVAKTTNVFGGFCGSCTRKTLKRIVAVYFVLFGQMPKQIQSSLFPSSSGGIRKMRVAFFVAL